MYYMSLFRLPKKVGQRIVHLQRRFFWGKGEGELGGNLVSWEVMVKPKNQGGLGIGDIFIKNAALLFKWRWRFADGKEALWKKIIQSIHGINCVGDLQCANKNEQKSMWKNLMHFECFNKETREVVHKGIQIKVGSGTRTKFWMDPWIGEQCLQKVYPRLFYISDQKEGYISDLGVWEGGGWRWKLRWRRKLFAWEEELVGDLLSAVNRVPLSVNTRDERVWYFDNSLSFSVANFVLQVHKLMERHNTHEQLGKMAWRRIAPPRAQIHLWLVLQGRINTKQRLFRWGIKGIQDDRCILCGDEAESIEHIFFSCKIVVGLWFFCCEQWKISFCFPKEPKACLNSWLGVPFRGFEKKIWVTMFFVIVWSTWNIRNKMIFQGFVPNWNIEKQRLFWRLAVWTRGWCPSFPFTPCSVLDNWNMIRKWRIPKQNHRFKTR